MFKVHRFIFDRDIAKIEISAKVALHTARETILKVKEEGEQMPECSRCKVVVSLPCWYCAECPREWGENHPLRIIVSADYSVRQWGDSYV